MIGIGSSNIIFSIEASTLPALSKRLVKTKTNPSTKLLLTLLIRDNPFKQQCQIFLGRERTTCITVTIQFPRITDLIHNLSRVFFYTPTHANSLTSNPNKNYITEIF